MELEAPAAAKRSRSEQRKVRCRDAARCRRGQETEVFYELASVLPLPRRVSSHLDKAAIMRVTLSYLRLRHLLTAGAHSEEEEDPNDQFYPQVLGGFIMVLSEEGDLIYLTENVSAYIGITQLELLGQNVFEFVHPCDQEELKDLMTTRSGVSKKPNLQQLTERSFFLRMKNTLTSRGRTVNLKSATWKVLHCTGHMRAHGGCRVLSVLCEPLPHPSSVEFPLDSSTLLTRHSMDLTFTHCEGRVLKLLGYQPDHLIGCSAYHFYHALDFDHVSTSLQTCLSKGQVRTRPYRFLAGGGGFVWVETQATVLYGRTGQPDAIVCLNFILSSVEQTHVVFSVEQRHSADLVKQEALTPEEEPPEDTPETTPEDTPKEPCSPALCPDLTQLSFSSSKAITDPKPPEDLCSPALRKLLSPIFNTSSPEESLEPIEGPNQEPNQEPSQGSVQEPMDTSGVERFFFSRWPETDQEQGHTLLHMEDMDLDMLAPYISMDDDFQLSALCVTDDVELQDSQTHNTRKRGLSVEAEVLPEKRHKVFLTEDEELLQSQALLGCLEDRSPSERGWNQLLTDKDPILGGVQSERTALMTEMFFSRPPDLSLPL